MSGSGTTTLIRGAAVVTMDAAGTEHGAADIMIRDGVITAIGPNLDPGPDAAGAEVIDATGMIAIPGFVDSHRHMWEGLIRNAFPDATLMDYFHKVMGGFGAAYTPDDVHAGTLLSALGAINAGVTTVLDWAHIQNAPDYTDASIDALRSSGVRAVFGFGMPTVQDRGHCYPDDILRLAKGDFASRDQLLTLSLAGDSPEYVPPEAIRHAWQRAREAGARITIHAGVAGIGDPTALERFADEGMLGPDVTLVHCSTFSPDMWRRVADAGATVSIAPQVELQMGHGSAPFQSALDVGLLPSLSVDVETSLPGDFFTQMRCTMAEQRGAAFRKLHQGQEMPALVGVRDVMRMATMGGAIANGLSDKVGSLEVGKQGDVVLLRADSINVLPINDLVGAVVAMDVGNVDTVLIGGRIMKRAGVLVGVDLPALTRRIYEARDGVFARANMPCGCPHHIGRSVAHA